jgi:hypothetical protein
LEADDIALLVDNYAHINAHILPRVSLRMLFIEDLLRDRSKFADCNLGDFHLIFGLIISEEVMLIALIVVEIVVLLCNTEGSLIAKD